MEQRTKGKVFTVLSFFCYLLAFKQNFIVFTSNKYFTDAASVSSTE